MAHRNFTVRKKIATSVKRNQDVEKFVDEVTYRCTCRRCNSPHWCPYPGKVARRGWVAARRTISFSCACSRSRTPTMPTIWTIRRPRLAREREKKKEKDRDLASFRVVKTESSNRRVATIKNLVRTKRARNSARIFAVSLGEGSYLSTRLRLLPLLPALNNDVYFPFI